MPERALDGGGIASLLDAGFGFFVWAAHLLAVYIATAVSCQLGLGSADASSQAAFRWTLVIVTIVAAAIVCLHGILRLRRYRRQPSRRFRSSVTIGCDAIAGVGIVWQLMAVSLVTACV